MEINLRKANAIQAEIKRAINNATAKDTVSVTEYTADIDAEVATAIEAFVTDTKRKVALTNALYNIRRSVANANATAGINAILTDVQGIEAEMAIFSAIVSKQVAKNLDEIKARVQKMKEAPQDARSAIYGDRYNTVETSAVDQATINHAKARVVELKRQRQNLQDKLLALNVTTQITVGEVDEMVLKVEGII